MADPKVKVVVEVDDSQAKKFEETLRALQRAANAAAMSMQTVTAASAKYDAATTKTALANEKLAQAAAKTALANQKLATEAERTAITQARAADASVRVGTAQTQQAIAAQRLVQAESQVALAGQRVATEAERTAAAQTRAAQAKEKAAQAATKLSAQDKEVARLTALGEKELARYEQRLARTATAKADVAAKTATLRQQFETFATTLRNVTLAAGVVGETFRQAFDLAKEGAQITQTTIAFDHFATSIAGTPQLLENLRTASRGTISDFDLMRNTLTLVAGTTQEVGAGLAQNAPQLLEIARAAQILNPALGDVNYFYQSLATGLKRLEPRWIDNLGLIVRARDAYAAHARELGISTTALTAEQKSQAFLNEVLRVGNLLIEQNAGAVTSAVDPYSRLEVQVQETGNAIKQFLGQGILPYVQLLNGEFAVSSDEAIRKNEEVGLSFQELSEAYQDLQGQLRGRRSGIPLLPFFFDDADVIESNMGEIRAELALTAGSFEEFAATIEGVSVERIGRIMEINPEFFSELQRLYSGVIIGSQQHKAALDASNESQEESIALTDEQIEALEKAREAWADVARGIVANAGDLNEFAKGLLAAADTADLTAGQIFRMTSALGLLSESEQKAAENAHAFQQVQARLMAEFARTNDVQAFVQGITTAAQRLGIDYQTAAQKAAQATQLLTQASSLGLGSLVRYAQGLGNAAVQALKLKKANDAAAQSASNLATVSAGAASAFINALEGSTSGGGGGGSAIDAAVEAQKEWNAAFAQSFMQLLDAEEPIENWNTELLKSAAAAGASAETLALLAAATGEYSEEQIRTALHGAAMKNAIEEIAQALADGRATTDEALAAVTGFQEQLAQGGDFKFDIEAFGIEPLQEAAAAAGGGASSAAAETTNWTTELLKLAQQGNLTADDLVILAGATGEYTDAQIQAALKTLFMTQKLEELSQQIGKRPIQDIIDDLRQFESDLDKEFQLQFNTGEAEEAIGRVSRGIADLPDEKTITIKIKADPVPDIANLPGSANPSSGSEVANQLGGPLAGTTLVGEVRPEMVVGGQVIPRIPPGFFMNQSGFADSVASALKGGMVAPPSYNNTININRSNTVQNNQRSVVINNATPASASQSTRRELGAF